MGEIRFGLGATGFCKNCCSFKFAVSGVLRVASAKQGPKVVARKKRGGHSRLGLDFGKITDTLDPATYQETFDYTLARRLHRYSAEVDATGGVDRRQDLAV